MRLNSPTVDEKIIAMSSDITERFAADLSKNRYAISVGMWMIYGFLFVQVGTRRWDISQERSHENRIFTFENRFGPVDRS